MRQSTDIADTYNLFYYIKNIAYTLDIKRNKKEIFNIIVFLYYVYRNMI